MANGAIPSRSTAEARKRHRGQLVQWDASSKTGYVQLEKPYLDVDVAELWAHDLRKYRTKLEEGQYLNFVIGIEPQAHAVPCLRCGDAVPSRSRSPRRTGSAQAEPDAHDDKIQFEEDDDADSQIGGLDLGNENASEDEQCFAAEDAKSEASDEPERLQREADDQRLEELNRYREDRPRRVLLDWTPRTGRICDWNADATEGWIEPDELIAGPRGRPRQQRVWFSDSDLSSAFDPFHPDFDIEKLACKFLLYEAQGEMCAAFVTLTDEGCLAPQRKLPPLQVLAPESPSPKNESPDGPEEPEGFEETDEEVPGYEEEVDPPAAEPAREGQQNARAFLQREVPEAVRVFEDAETTWSVSEMGKRMTKYFVGGLSAAAEKRSDWRSSGKRFLEKGIRSFTNACGSRKWFNDAEEVLKPLLAHATWEVVQDCENAYEATEELTRELVDEAYLDMWEYQNFDVAVQDAVRRSFKDLSGQMQQKVMQALARTHQGAEKESAVEGNLLRQIEVFTETWVNQSMDRACTMINSELLDEETVVQLFRFLLHPEFSKTYSCVPASLRKNGRPPRGWKFLRPCVQEMLRRWADAQGVAPNRGERRTSRSPGRPFVRKRQMPSELRER